jgi:hypothetical protein
MPSRPTSITVISWIIMVTSVFGLISSVVMMGNPMVTELMAKIPIPIAVQYGMRFGVLTFNFIFALFMLKGRNWARMLYVAVGAVCFAINLVTSPVKLMMLPGLILFAVVVFFLFRPRPNAFFGGSTNAQSG